MCAGDTPNPMKRFALFLLTIALLIWLTPYALAAILTILVVTR